jgi:hypothetical protein
MLLRELVEVLQAPEYAVIYAKLHVEDFIQFCLLASDVLKRGERGLNLTSTELPVQYISSAMRVNIPNEALVRLWRIMFPVLPRCFIVPKDCIKKLGLHPLMKTQIPFCFLFPPTQHCYHCDPHKRKPLAFKKDLTLNGYMYTLKGVFPIKSISFYCTGVLIILNKQMIQLSHE